jgi:hypothetical protein
MSGFAVCVLILLSIPLLVFFFLNRKPKIEPVGFDDEAIEPYVKKLDFMAVGVEYPTATLRREWGDTDPVYMVMALEHLVRKQEMVRIYRVTNPADGTITEYSEFMSIPDIPGLGFEHVALLFKRVV